MKCLICENYFDRDHTKFVKWHNGTEYIKICPDCFSKKPKPKEDRVIQIF